MMKEVRLILLAMAMILAAGVSCRKQEKEKTDVTQSDVVISFSSAVPVTRAGNGVVADGGGIFIDGSDNPDLYIAIVNYQGNVVATYPDTANPDDVEKVDASATLVSIRFKNISYSGEYTVYALANTYVDGSEGIWGAPANASEWEALTTASALDALVLTDPGDDPMKLTITDRMPLSAKGTLSISENLNGHVELEMLRCVGKVGFKFKNETDESITLTDCVVQIKDIRTTEGYLFPRPGDDATGTPRTISLNKSSIVIAGGTTTDLYDMQLVFPSIAPARAVGNRYFCDISFTYGGVYKAFTDLPIHDKMSQDIQALGRNQYLQIETRINKGNDISFNFEVIDWTRKQEEIIFH
jgi:hypothetical protein